MIVCMWRGNIPKTALRLNDLLEGLTKLRKAVLIIVLYYSEKLLVKIGKGKMYLGQCLGETEPQASDCLLSVESHRQHLILPATMCDNT